MGPTRQVSQPARKQLRVDVHHEDGSYWAEVRELPGCFASGDAPGELVEAVEEAVGLYLAPADGDEAPPLAIELAGLDFAVNRSKHSKPRSAR